VCYDGKSRECLECSQFDAFAFYRYKTKARRGNLRCRECQGRRSESVAVLIIAVPVFILVLILVLVDVVADVLIVVVGVIASKQNIVV